jgi:hypothetical protein
MLTPLTKLRLMSEKELHNTLMREYPTEEGIRSDIKARLFKEREDKRSAKIKKAQQRKAWAPLIHQAYKAVNTPMARLRKAQEMYDSPMGYGSVYEEGFEESPSALALDTYKAYVALLKKVADRLRSFRDRDTHTPKQMAKEDGIPNEGEHWTDWVPANIKAATVRAFARLNEDSPLELFPRTYYAPAKKQEYKPRKRKSTRTRPMTHVEQLREALMEADKLCLERPTPENLAQRDTLILQKEEAAREKRREYARRYHAKIRAELREWREKQKQLEGEVK